MKTVAIIPAGGFGKRMQGRLSKQYLPVEGKPILIHTLSIFQLSPAIDEIVLITPEEDVQAVGQMVLEPLVSWRRGLFLMQGKCGHGDSSTE